MRSYLPQLEYFLPNPDPELQTFAAVDLGSNSFHLVVARYEHGTLNVIDRLKEMVRLAAGVDEDGTLDPETGERALECLARFGERLAGIPTERVRVAGTNALRQIDDGLQFLTSAESRLGHPIEIISGVEEARLVYLGVAHGISEQGNQRLVIDVGGGSTEFAIGQRFEPFLLESLYFGCVGITQRFFADGRITPKRWKKAHMWVARELERICDDVSEAGWDEVIGSSGTMKAVRDAMLERGFSERGISGEGMASLKETLLAAETTDRIELPTLSDRRRPVFVGGAVIVDAIQKVLEIDRILVADYALREGLLYDMVGRQLHDDPRQASVDAQMARYHVDTSQSRRVARTAVNLFDQVSEGWGLAASSRNILIWTAQLHELGLAISHHGYHRHGAYIIGNTDMLGFSRLEQSIMAVLIDNQRRRPSPGDYDALLPRVQPTVRRLSALLRVAILLNRTRRTGPVRIRASARDDQFTLSLDRDWLDDRPLVMADLMQESSDLERIGIKLIVRQDRSVPAIEVE